MTTALTLINRARKGGIVIPARAYRAAKAAGVPYALACALLEQESGGGHNIYGHDGGPGWNHYGAGEVNRANYAAYKRERNYTHQAQGVGPLQLTYPPFQDRADAAGGCWKAYTNTLVGLQVLAELTTRYNSGHDAAAAYNAGTPNSTAGQAYADEVALKAARWRNILNP